MPEAVVQSLVLPAIGTIAIGGVGGIVQAMPSYPVELTLHTSPAVVLEVVPSNRVYRADEVLRLLDEPLDETAAAT